MPEVGIGFFPDVGATWLLPRLPGQLGSYCALTGERLDAADAMACGIATHRVQSAAFPDLIEGLCGAVAVDALLAAFAQPPGEGTLMRHRSAIDRLFAGDRVEDILARLDAEIGPHGDFARRTAATIRAKSPLSLKVALALLRRGWMLDFDECMRTEYRAVSRIVRAEDLYEGIRAVIIDKDQAPHWRPSALEAISEAEVERYFAPLAQELDLTTRSDELDLT
jgi:enoyl-CoA hydratase/carnithine racemase